VDQALYGDSELAAVPEIARNLSRGCGNPTGFANLETGEVVVDFGCGSGIDVILAAHKVGTRGRVVGIDFAPAMIERARQAVKEAGLADYGIELRAADMTQSRLPSGFADAVTSNCVINLCPDKEAVYAEALRVLRPGGRLAISDVVLTEPIDRQLRERFQDTWSGCLGGAIPEADYWETVERVGFVAVEVVSRHVLTPMELAAMAGCPGEDFTPPPKAEDLALVAGKVASVKFSAVKPVAGAERASA
jgi:SAM-dependent methyltransferase